MMMLKYLLMLTFVLLSACGNNNCDGAETKQVTKAKSAVKAIPNPVVKPVDPRKPITTVAKKPEPPVVINPNSAANRKVSRWAATVIREGRFINGINSPTAMYLSQIKQESNGDEKVTAWDNGRGLTQFMDGTIKQVVNTFPELGPANPYNPTWAIRAQVRYVKWLKLRVQGDTECDQYAAALKSYNAGLGYVQQSQKASKQPGKWFGLTEYVDNRQSDENFEYSRLYPRRILFRHQPNFVSHGGVMCDIKNPPVDVAPVL